MDLLQFLKNRSKDYAKVVIIPDTPTGVKSADAGTGTNWTLDRMVGAILQLMDWQHDRMLFKKQQKINVMIRRQRNRDKVVENKGDMC
jgi:hypothetical protein